LSPRSDNEEEVARNPSLIGPWLPILQQFGPSLLVECQNHIKLSETLVAGWLEQYMFRGQQSPRAKARKLARYLANDKNFLSHGRRVDARTLRANGAIIERVEDLEGPVRNAINRVHLTIMATFDMTKAVKIFENSQDAVLIRMVRAQPTPQPQP
jgi:hypothetical protein